MGHRTIARAKSSVGEIEGLGAPPYPGVVARALSGVGSATLMTLTGKQKRHLRSLGHHLDALVSVGKNGLNDSVTRAVDAALEQHELIKVRLLTECPEDRSDVAQKLSEALGAGVAQEVGRTMLLYRRHPREPKIKLPAAEPSTPQNPPKG